MYLSLPKEDLVSYVSRLLGNHLPDGYAPGDNVSRGMEQALERVEYCFSHINRKYYRDANGVLFHHTNTDHMAAFLWFLGNTIWTEFGDESTPVRLFYLNKIMHGLDLYYSVQMPAIFMLLHPVGSVIGRAKYNDYLVVSQNCTVGAETDVYPTFGSGVVLNSHSSAIGDCRIGDNVVLGAGAMLVDTSIPSNTVVVGRYPNIRKFANKRTVVERHFAAGDWH